MKYYLPLLFTILGLLAGCNEFQTTQKEPPDIWIDDAACNKLICSLTANGLEMKTLRLESKAFAPDQKLRIHCSNGKLLRYPSGPELDSLVLKPSGAEKKSKTITCYFKAGTQSGSSLITALVNKLQSPPIVINYKPSCPTKAYFTELETTLLRNGSDPTQDIITVVLKLESTTGLPTQDLNYSIAFKTPSSHELQILSLGPYILEPDGSLKVQLTASNKAVGDLTSDTIQLLISSDCDKIETSNTLTIAYQ